MSNWFDSWDDFDVSPFSEAGAKKYGIIKTSAELNSKTGEILLTYDFKSVYDEIRFYEDSLKRIGKSHKTYAESLSKIIECRIKVIYEKHCKI